MKFIFKIVEKSLHTKVDGKALGLFRILYCSVLFCGVCQLYYFRHLIFDKVPYLVTYEIGFTIPLLLWLGVLICMILGFLTRIMSVFNYLFTIFFLSTNSSYEYHMDYLYIATNFLLMFLPIANRLSIDSILSPARFDRKVSELSNYLPIFICLGLVYFDSVFHKLFSQMWRDGLGVWLPASIPQTTYLNINWILNQEYLMYIGNWLTLILELFLVFTFWIKSLRFFYFSLGVIFHIGIIVFFPIPWFGLAMISYYILFIPNEIEAIRFPTICNLSRRITQIKQLKIFKSVIDLQINLPKLMLTRIVFGFILVCISLQIITTLNAPAVNWALKSMSVPVSFLNLTKYIYTKTVSISKPLLGITAHRVFVDSHFNGYNHIISIRYKNGDKEDFLPIINESGQVGFYNTGRQWAKYTFRISSPDIDQNLLSAGIKSLTAFYAHKNEIDLANAEFSIYVKKIEISTKWQKNWLKDQMSRPWLPAGKVKWKDSIFISEIDQIETL